MNKLKYIKFGEGKRNLIILPGLNIGSILKFEDAIAKQYENLTNDFTIYVFDQLEKPNDNYTLYKMADDIYYNIELLNINNLYLFGVSMGGMLSIILASKYHSFKKVVLANTSSYTTKDSFEITNSWVDLAIKGKKEELYLKYLSDIYTKDFFEQNIDLFKTMAKDFNDDDLKQFIIYGNSISNVNLNDKLENIKCNTLVIADKTDKLFGLALVNETKNLPNFEYYIYDGFNHAPYDLSLDFPNRLKEFLLK